MTLHLRDVPPALLDAVDEDAQDRGVSVPDRVCELLAGFFAVPHETSGRPYRQREGATISIRPYDRLHRKLKVRAARNGEPMRTLALRILADSYDL